MIESTHRIFHTQLLTTSDSLKEKCAKSIAQAPIGMFVAKYCTIVEIRKDNRTLVHPEDFEEEQHSLIGKPHPTDVERTSPEEEREAHEEDLGDLEELVQIIARKSRENRISPKEETETPENNDVKKHLVKKIISVLSKYEFLFCFFFA